MVFNFSFMLKLVGSEFKPEDLNQRREHIKQIAAAVHVTSWKPKVRVIELELE
jgi:hypothetical protein